MLFKAKLTIFIFAFAIFLSSGYSVFAQSRSVSIMPINEATQSANSTSSASQAQKEIDAIKEDITKPEAPQEKVEIIDLFKSRPAEELKATNFMAYLVQESVSAGVPANTIVLILLLPFLATFFALARIVVGFTTMEMLVTIILSIAFIATGITIGAILLSAIIIASFFSRILLKKLKIMQIPKMAMSLLVVSFFVFITLTLSAQLDVVNVTQISIFPILVFILISDKIVTLQLQRNYLETVRITIITVAIAFLGYLFLSSTYIQKIILIYPEVILILIPLNILLGRYFGLRLTEYVRFSSLFKNGNK